MLKRMSLGFAMLGVLSSQLLAAGGAGVPGDLPLFWGVPFAGVLLSIALFPLVMTHFWHHNYGKVAAFWAVIFALPFYSYFHEGAVYEIAHIILLDYVPFIILLAALFTAAGGICLKGKLRGSPVLNTAILALGTALASFMGTTGAAMLLIRPLIRANKWRQKKVHLIVFFIFLVANIGGSLLPIGDPPLFLGFLKGVEFFWTFKLFPMMLPLSLVLLLIFFIVDSILYKKEGVPPDDGVDEPIKIEGGINFIFLAGIIGAILLSSSLSKDEFFFDKAEYESQQLALDQAVEIQVVLKTELMSFVNENEGKLEAVKEEHLAMRTAHLDAVSEANALRFKQTHDATKGLHILGVTVPFTNLLRDGLMMVIFFFSMMLTKKQTREDNFFTWEPILEVAKLFAAIFITIVPVLKILQYGVHGELASVIWAVLGPDNEPNNAMFFWFTGMLSSFLDNAPTYVVFFNTAGGDANTLMGPLDVGLFTVTSEAKTLLAISAGAVFMGANTYIGNAPNFMVKAIAEENDIKMPSFFGYMAWSFGILLPIFLVLTWIFF